MSDEPFLRAIWANPRDDGPLSIYADWLEERGDSRAEYLRARLSAQGVGADLHLKNESRLHNLFARVPHDWAALLALADVPVAIESWHTRTGEDDTVDLRSAARGSEAFTFEQGRLIVGTIMDDEWPVGLHAFGTLGETEIYRLTLEVRQGDRLDERILFDLRRLYRDALNYAVSYDGILDRHEFEEAARRPQDSESAPPAL